MQVWWHPVLRQERHEAVACGKRDVILVKGVVVLHRNPTDVLTRQSKATPVHVLQLKENQENDFIREVENKRIDAQSWPLPSTSRNPKDLRGSV